MDKKRNNDTPESRGESERKKSRRTKAEEADASIKEPEGSEKQLQHLPGKEADNSEANVKFKMGLGEKRTKKPPKSLENFICRPPIRVSQKPGPVVGDGIRAKTKGSNQSRHPAQNKSSSDSLATKTSSSMISAKENPSTLSPSSLTPSRKVSSASDSSNTTAAKKVLSKQSRKTIVEPESTLEECSNTNQSQSSSKMSVYQRKTSVKQTSPHTSTPSSPTPSQQDPSPQEVTEAVSTIQQALRHGNPSEIKDRSCKRNLVTPKQTSCLTTKDLKPTVNHTETSSSVNLNLNRKEGEASRCPKNSDSRTSGKNKYQTGSSQKPSSFSNDQPDNIPSVQVTVSCNPEGNQGSERENEHEDLCKTLEMTMKSSQAISVLEQQKQDSTEGILDEEHGKRIKHFPNQEQIKSPCSSDSNPARSILNPQISPTSARPSVNDSTARIKKGKNSSKKDKLKHSCNKIAKMTNQNNQNPGACTAVLQGSQKNDAPKAPALLQGEQMLVGQFHKSKQSKNLAVTSKISAADNTQSRKRGRPKMKKIDGCLQENSFKASSSISSDNKIPQVKSSQVSFRPDPDPELDGKRQRSTVPRKRGRPKRSFSVQSQSAQVAITSKQRAYQMTSEEKMKDTQQKSNRSNRVMMKTIIQKINKMKVKRKDQVLTQILLGQKQHDDKELPQEDSGAELCSPVSPDTHSLSSLVTSFGGKLGPQINVSKRGTIYMGKRRGRKPKYERNSSLEPKLIPSPHSQQEFNSMHQSLDSQTGSCSLRNDASSSPSGRSSQINLSNQKVKATSFIQLSEFQKSTFTSNTGMGVKEASTLDRSVRDANGRVAASIGFPSVFTMSGVQGSSSLKGKSKTLSSYPSEHLSSGCFPLGSGRMQNSNGTQIVDPTLSFTNQEAHKFKCHRRGHHCIGRDKLRRHKYKCKKKCMQLRAKSQDPDFLAEVEDLVVRLREIHIVHHITRPRLDDGGTVGRKSTKSKSHDLQCLQEDVHPPTMFQINFSGYYSPHSTLSCDPLRYVRMANMKRKHGCSSEPNEQIVTHFPIMHKLGYPVSGGGFFHPSYKVPFTTASLGFGLYRGYPSTTPLYPSSFPSSYVHHYSKNPIISPSKFHKKKTKVSKQDSGGHWSGKSLRAHPRMTPNFSCDCFTKQKLQREKHREKIREGRDEHGKTRGREQDTERLLWQNKLSKDKESLRDSSFKHSSSFSVFSNIQNKDKKFPSNLRQMRGVRWSEHQPPWQCMKEFDSKLGSRRPNQEFSFHEHEDTLEEPESNEELTTTQQTDRRMHSFLKQPILFSNTQSQRRIRKRNEVTSSSMFLREQDGTTLEDFSSLADKRAGCVQACSLQSPGKYHLNNSPTAREPEREPKGHKGSRRPLLQDEGDRMCDESVAHFMQEHTQHHFKKPRNTARAKLTQHFRSSNANNPRGLKVTAGNEVKKRGRGRPRKNPPHSPCKTDLSPPPLFCAPPPPPPPEQLEKAGKGGSGKHQGDSVLEAVVHREQRRRARKRRNTEEGEDEGQKDNDGTEISLDIHESSSPTAPSPDQTAPSDTESEGEDETQSEGTCASPPIKKYLWAGLYSDVYKTENIVEPQQRTECLDYNPEEHEHGLLPAPLHVGKYLRLKRMDFQLPYDISWLYAHSKLFKTSGNPPPALTCDGSCRAIDEKSAPQYSDDDCSQTCHRLPERNNQADVPQLHKEVESCLQPVQQQEESRDSEDFPSPLSSEERSFVMKHGVFLVRNYEKMKARQALLLLAEGMREREEEEEEKGSSEKDVGNGEKNTIQPDRYLSDQRSCPEEEEQTGDESRPIKHTLQEILDRIIGCKGSSGQTLTAPLLNLCSRKRSDSALLDLTVVQKQLQAGYYDSLEAFHTDMLRVFQCAEKYYGCESSVGRDVSQLRALYHTVHQDASTHISQVL